MQSDIFDAVIISYLIISTLEGGAWFHIHKSSQQIDPGDLRIRMQPTACLCQPVPNYKDSAGQTVLEIFLKIAKIQNQLMYT